MNIDKILAEMDAEYRAEKEAHEARMAEMEKEHKAEMEKLRVEREAVEAEVKIIDAEIEAIDAEIAASKERTSNSKMKFEAAQERLLQARTPEEYASAYSDLMAASEALFNFKKG